MTTDQEKKDYSENRGGRNGARYIDPSKRKVKDIKKTIKNVFYYFKKYIPFFILAMIAALLGSILALIGPSFLSRITNLIENGLSTKIDFDLITKISIQLICIYLGARILSTFQGIITATISAKMSRQMRNQIVNKLNKLPIKFFDKNTIGDILSRITNDVFILTNNINNSLTTIISSSIMLIGSTFLMFYTNWLMAVTAIFSVGFGISFVFFIMKKSQKYFDAQQKYLGEINGHVEEAFTGHSIIKAYGGENEMKEKFIKINETLKRSSFMASFLTGTTMPIIKFTNNLGYIVVGIVGAILALKGNIEFGIIVAFLVYVRYFSQPIIQSSGLIQRLQVALAAAERIFNFLDEEELIDESNKKEIKFFKKGKVEFNHVYFGYSSDKKIIKDISFTANPGEKIAIVGPTGSGKTTIINLLMRFYEIDKGTIKIDGTNTKDISRDDIHNLFCMVLQDSRIFEGTIKENIIYNKKDATEQDVIKACKAVGLHHFIMTLPKGYDTILDEKITLSMGQKQQLTIARAMVFNAPMLILDEATSSIDTRTELNIQSAMDKLMENRTSFIIAHRLSTIKNADCILVIKNGEIIEQGKHDELIKKQGFYCDIYKSQFVDS